MEINITKFFNEACPRDYSASIAEIGNNAGQSTWRAANDDAPEYNMLDTEDKRDAFRAYVKTFGAWNEEEIAAWSDTELNALLIQMISGDIRASMYLECIPIDWNAYEADTEGAESHNIFKGIDEQIYYSFEG